MASDISNLNKGLQVDLDIFTRDSDISELNTDLELAGKGSLGVVDIYGHIPDKSKIILAVGNYNNIHGLLTYFPSKDLLQIQFLSEIVPRTLDGFPGGSNKAGLQPSILELILTYEKPSNVNNTNRIYFSLGVKDLHDLPSVNSIPSLCLSGVDVTPGHPKGVLVKETSEHRGNVESLDIHAPLNDNNRSTIISQQKIDKYINVKIELDGDKKVACTYISSEKAFFWIDYSSVDKNPRSQLLAGVLYALKTVFGEQEYTVSWKIQGFSNGDLIIFLPTTWYEQKHDNKEFCEMKSGVTTLVESLQQLSFKGYTSQQWCEEAPYITYCTINDQCGYCLGQCQDPNTICYVNTDTQNTQSEGSRWESNVLLPKFICGSPSLEPKFNQSNMVSFADNYPQTTGNAATWIALISIVIIVALLTWGLSLRST